MLSDFSLKFWSSIVPLHTNCFFYRNAVILILQVTWKAPTGKVGPYSKWRPRSWGHWVPRLRMPTKADLARPEEDFRDQEQSLPSIILAWKMADATNPANTIGNFLEACVSFIEIVVICYLRGGSEGEICIVCTPIQDSITSATFFHSSWARVFFGRKSFLYANVKANEEHSKRRVWRSSGERLDGPMFMISQDENEMLSEDPDFFSIMTCSQFRELAFCFFFWNIFCRLESSDSQKC